LQLQLYTVWRDLGQDRIDIAETTMGANKAPMYKAIVWYLKNYVSPEITACNISGVTAFPPIPQFSNSTSSMTHQVYGTRLSFGWGLASISATVSDMPDDIKIYLLHKLFRFSAPEIGNMYDRHETSIAATIKRIADKMMCGEINLLTVTTKDAAKAKKRIEKKRAKMKEHRRKHWEKNKDRINAKRREQYAQSSN